jgi:hypothetical protein
MTVKLELTPEIEENLLAQARAKGLSLEDYAVRVLGERSRIAPTEGRAPADLARAFERWAHNHPALPPLPDEAFRRANMLRDAG